MSPEARRAFEAEWAVLSQRLRLLLVRKRVQPAFHDDLVQETAVRLLSMWDNVDRRRPLWPLTVTIALNLLRDHGRTVHRDHPVAEVPERRSVHDVEAAGLARVELDRVLRAMAELSGSQRSALLKEVGADGCGNAADGSADKMRRMRARRKLKLAMEKVSGLVGLRLRRVSELVEGAVALREGTMSAASCAFCLMIGIGAAVAPPAALIPPAAAGSVRTTTPADGYAAQQGTTSTRIAAGIEPRPGSSAVRRSGGVGENARKRATAGRKGNGDRSARTGQEADPTLVDALPHHPGDQPITPPADDVGIDVPGAPPSPPDVTSVQPPPVPSASQPPPTPPVPVPSIEDATEALL